MKEPLGYLVCHAFPYSSNAFSFEDFSDKLNDVAQRFYTPMSWLLCLPLALGACESRPNQALPVKQIPSGSTAFPAPSAPASSAAIAEISKPAVQSPKLMVHLVPIGTVPKEIMQAAADGLSSHAHVEVFVENEQQLPKSCLSTQPNRYRSELLLNFLDSLSMPRGKVMGVTEVDIVARKGNNPNWGVLGLGSMDGRTSVLSTFRMRRKWENGGSSEAVVRDRLWKVALHELGHTLGLDHCPNSGCIMEDGHGTVKTTDRDNALCERCAALFTDSIRRNLDATQHN